MKWLKPSSMFGQDECGHESFGEVKTCRRCCYTGSIRYERTNPTDSNLEPIPTAMYGVCAKCGCKVFWNIFEVGDE